MSLLTYNEAMNPKDKPLVWSGGEVKSPPLSTEARIEAGFLLRSLQTGQALAMPQSRTMTTIGARCHELRIRDQDSTWRIVYRVDTDAIVILDVFKKKTGQTPQRVIAACRRRMQRYDAEAKDED